MRFIKYMIDCMLYYRVLKHFESKEKKKRDMDDQFFDLLLDNNEMMYVIDGKNVISLGRRSV